MALSDWFTWTRLTDKPEPKVVPPEEIGVVLGPGDVVQPTVGIPLSDEEFAGMGDRLPDDEIRVILDNKDQLSGEWIYVISSNVNAIKYNVSDSTMDVEYQYGRYYRYFDVPPVFFVDFYHSHSFGRFVWEHIRRPNAYRYVRLGGAGTRPDHGDNIQQTSIL